MLIQKCLGCYSHPFSELAPHFPTEPLLPHSSFSCPIPSIISVSCFPFYHISSSLSFLILPPHFPSSSFLILYIIALLPFTPSAISFLMPSSCSSNAFLFLPISPILPHPTVKNLQLLFCLLTIPCFPPPILLSLGWLLLLPAVSQRLSSLGKSPEWGFVWSQLILVSDIDPLFSLIDIHYANLSKLISIGKGHNKLCLAPMWRISIIVMQRKHHLIAMYSVGHYINTIERQT